MADAPLYDRIEWHEGMLLTPQHFQQESARVDALVAWQALAGHPAAWGVRRLEVDEAALGGGLVRIRLLEAILPNGMAVRYDAGLAQGVALELDLADHAGALAQEGIDVWLVLGTTRSLRLPGQPAMFRSIASALVDDEVSEALAEEVPRMAPKLALAAGKEPGAAWISLQLMRLCRENEIVRRGAYWPAQLEVSPTSTIFQRAGKFAALVRAKAMFLAQQSSVNASRTEDRLATLEQRMLLAQLTMNLPLLEATLAAGAVQPRALYFALCAQLGALAALRPGTVPLAPPPYVHADSHAAFTSVLATLEGLVNEVSQEWRSIAFTYDGTVFAVPMQDVWLTRRLVVGLRGQGEREVGKWMAGATIGSRTMSASLRDRRMPGARRAQIEHAPELNLRASGGTILFEIAADPQFIVAGQDLLISNDGGAGDGSGLAAQHALRPQEIVLYVKE
jgi:type VI secretion system protein ImpJ